MSIQLTPSKTRAYCSECMCAQPLLKERKFGHDWLVCSACLTPLSKEPQDIIAAKDAIKGVLVPPISPLGNNQDGLPRFHRNRPWNGPVEETRPAIIEETR